MNDSITFRFLASPLDTSSDGVTVAPGRVMEWIDKAGYACAVGWASAYCVTVYVGNVRFSRAIAAGELIEVDAHIVHTGTTSMHVMVRVGTTNVRDREYVPAMSCILVFIAVDDERRPTPVPPWHPRDDESRELQHRAEERVGIRRRIKEAMLAQDYTDAGTTPRTRFRFLAAPTDRNWGGKVHGGTMMKWIAEAAHTAATSWEEAELRLVYSGGIHFLCPISIGRIVEIDARVIFTFDTQIHVAVRVSSASARTPNEGELTTVCMCVFEARTSEGYPILVHPLMLESDEDRRLAQHALDLVQLRSSMRPLAL